MKIWKDTVRILKLYREGFIIGGLVGAVAAWYALGQGYDLASIADAGKGVLDSLMSRSAPVTIATYKFYGVFITVGALLGGLCDIIITRFFSR